MAISSTLKIALATVSLGGVVTGTSVGAYSYLSKSNDKEQKSKNTNIAKTSSITSLLRKDNLALISPNDDKDKIWTPKYNDFKNAHKNQAPSGIWTIENWNSVKDQDIGLNIFKELCVINGGNSVENREAEIYKKVKQYCTKELTTTPSEQS